jgi:FkbM family methyltransferase
MHVWARTLRPGDRFVDVGANVGAFSLWAAEHGARVLALEPATDTFARLMENVELNDYPIDARRLAVAARPGTARLTVGLDDVNHLLVSSDAVVAEEVEVTTLDALIGGERVAGVKIDVEGAERLVLEGATEALGDRRIGLLQLEWNSSSLDLLGEDREPVAELLRSTGYELLAAEGNGRLRPLPSTRFRDDVFARPRC